MEQLNQRLAKLPIVVIGLLVLAYLGYDYYDWLNSPQSELGQKKAALVASKTDLEGQKKKLAAAEEFFRNLETLKIRIRQLTAQLESTKSILSSDIDIANLVSMLTLESRKLKIKMKGLKPEAEKKKEYFVEVPYSLTVRGAYVQLLVLLDRIAKFQQVIRVGDFQMKPVGNNTLKYVELEATVRLQAYKYLGTAADEVSKKVELMEAPKTDAKPAAGATKGSKT